jgi:hypothetical protein
MAEPHRLETDDTPNARGALVPALAAVAHPRDGASLSNGVEMSSAPERAPRFPRRPRMWRPLLTLLRLVLIAGTYCYIMANLVATIAMSKKATRTTDGLAIDRGRR